MSHDKTIEMICATCRQVKPCYVRGDVWECQDCYNKHVTGLITKNILPTMTVKSSCVACGCELPIQPTEHYDLYCSECFGLALRGVKLNEKR